MYNMISMDRNACQEYAAQLAVQMRKGLLVYCSLLICSKGEISIADIIQKMRNNSLLAVEGTMYPLLNRLQKDGLLVHSWKDASQGPPRKYYRLSSAGHIVLEELAQLTHQLQYAINNIEKEQ